MQQSADFCAAQGERGLWSGFDDDGADGLVVPCLLLTVPKHPEPAQVERKRPDPPHDRAYESGPEADVASVFARHHSNTDDLFAPGSAAAVAPSEVNYIDDKVGHVTESDGIGQQSYDQAGNPRNEDDDYAIDESGEEALPEPGIIRARYDARSGLSVRDASPATTAELGARGEGRRANRAASLSRHLLSQPQS